MGKNLGTEGSTGISLIWGPLNTGFSVLFFLQKSQITYDSVVCTPLKHINNCFVTCRLLLLEGQV